MFKVNPCCQTYFREVSHRTSLRGDSFTNSGNFSLKRQLLHAVSAVDCPEPTVSRSEYTGSLEKGLSVTGGGKLDGAIDMLEFSWP